MQSSYYCEQFILLQRKMIVNNQRKFRHAAIVLCLARDNRGSSYYCTYHHSSLLVSLSQLWDEAIAKRSRKCGY